MDNPLSYCTTTEARNGSPSGCAESSQMISQPASTPNDIHNISVRSISLRRKPCRRPPGGKIGSRLRNPCCHRSRHPLHRLGSTGSGRIAFRQRCRRSDRPPSAGTAAGRAQNGYDRHVRSLHAGKSVHTTGGGSGCPGSNHCAGFGE